MTLVAGVDSGYWSAGTGGYRRDLLERAFGRGLDTPRVLEPSAVAGETTAGVVVAAGTGDNMGAALGLGAGPGDVVVSIGTSGTAFAVHDRQVADRSGAVAGFADATGCFLPLVGTLNAARVLAAAARMLGTDLTGLDDLALRAAPGAGGLVLLPYLDGERTPENVARAAVAASALPDWALTSSPAKDPQVSMAHVRAAYSAARDAATGAV